MAFGKVTIRGTKKISDFTPDVAIFSGVDASIEAREIYKSEGWKYYLVFEDSIVPPGLDESVDWEKAKREVRAQFVNVVATDVRSKKTYPEYYADARAYAIKFNQSMLGLGNSLF